MRAGCAHLFSLIQCWRLLPSSTKLRDLIDNKFKKIAIQIYSNKNLIKIKN
jgi:hypothetical protein